MKVSVAKEIFEKFPEYKVHLIVAKGVNVSSSQSKKILEGLRAAEEDLKTYVGDRGVSDVDEFKVWLEGYQSVIGESEIPNKLAKKMKPSHVALAERVMSGKKLPNINPLVNFYNAYSLKYRMPLGAENLGSYYGNLSLVPAVGTEKFLEINGTSVDVVSKGELVWKDDYSVSCRMWAWRQSERTKVDRDTKDIIFIVDDLLPFEDGSFGKWQSNSIFAKQLKEYFGAKVTYARIDADNPVVDIGCSTKSEVPDAKEIDSEMGASITDTAVKGSKGIRKRKPESMGFESSELLLNRVSEGLAEMLSSDIGDLGLNYSPSDQYGEVASTVAFRIAGKAKKAPFEVAQDLKVKLEESIDGSNLFEGVEVAPNGFLNLKLKDSYILNELVNGVSAGEAYGHFEIGAGKKIVVESPGWNPNKTPHVGHMLNFFLGKSLLKLFDRVGLEAVNDDIDNDKGLPVMQAMWAYSKYADGATPASAGDKSDHFVQRYYTLGKKKFNESEEVQAEVREYLKKWEAGDTEIIELWRRVVGWAYRGQKETIARVWEEPGYVWHESDVYQGGKDIVMSRLGKGVVEKLDDGAVVARIEQEYGLPDTVLLKSDGTGLYHTQDIGLTIKKKEKFDPWRMIWVVGEEQITHFQRLFAILDVLEIMPIDNLYHFAYAHVVGKDGKKLSSRDGKELSADELLDMMVSVARTILDEREGNEDMTDGVKDEISEAVGIGALKYALLSRDPFKKIKFDMNEALSYQGKSGPYVMYSYTRAMGVLRGLGVELESEVEGSVLVSKGFDDSTRRLVLQLLRYPETVLASANNYTPGILAEYLYDLAKAFNNFYENVSVSKSEGDAKLILIYVLKLFTHVLKDGLDVLGMKVLDRM